MYVLHLASCRRFRVFVELHEFEGIANVLHRQEMNYTQCQSLVHYSIH